MSIWLGFALLVGGVLEFFNGVFNFNFGYMIVGIVLVIISMGLFIGAILG